MSPVQPPPADLHPDASTPAEFQLLAQDRPYVLVFIPNTNELQRFVLSHAFTELAVGHRLHYVLPDQDAESMLRAAAPAISTENSTAISVPSDRFTKWTEVFRAACVHYAMLSSSFAIRARLDVDPAWRERWRMPGEQREQLDREFDAHVERLLHGMQPLPAIIQLLDRFQPVYCVVPTSLLDTFANEVAWACEVEEVSCVLLQSGWDNLSSKGLVYPRSSYLGCWGPQSAKHAHVIQRMNPKHVALLGAPHYEFLRPAPPDEVRQLRAELGVRRDERLVLFGGSFRRFDETTTLRVIEDAIASGRLGPMKIVYRPHPWRAARHQEDSFFDYDWSHIVCDPDVRQRYLRDREEPGYLERRAPMFDMPYLARLLSASDAVISPMSTLLLEALILDKPTMAIAFTDGKHRHNPSVAVQMTHFADIRESRVLIWCHSAEELVDDCARLLDVDPQLRAGPRRRLIRTLVALEPGTYAERLARFCRDTVEPTGRKRRARRSGVKRTTISHSYGAHLIAREYCDAPADAVVPGYWMHGWFPQYHHVHPALIAGHKRPNQDEGYDFEAQVRHEQEHVWQWVSRADQAEYLAAHGYRCVMAIGLPIVYLPDPDVGRVPGSLLVLPPHSHRTHGPGDPLAEQYATLVADLKRRFEHVWVGISADDVANGQWIDAFRRRSIDVLTTTDQGDPRTLARQRRILSTFEYVTTNGFGSHLALAAYCGAKVSVYGPYADFPRERLKRTHAVKMFPELLDAAYALCAEDALRAHYPFLFVEPDQAQVCRSWGAFEVGEQHRLAPGALSAAFGWEAAVGQPPAGVSAAAPT